MWPIEIKVFERLDGRWVAEINNGWWVAIAETRQGAINAVKRRYEQEQSKYFF